MLKKKANREHEIYVVTGIGSLVNLGLFLFKLISGILGHSTAMLADAFHSLTDFVTDIIVVVFVKLSSKPADKTHSYGHGKFETLATVFIALSMSAVGIAILVHSIDKIILVLHGELLAVPGTIALWAALLSILAKEILFRYTVRKGKQLESSAVVANAWHHRSDALSSICTALGIGGAILLGGRWAVLDPIAAAIVSIFIIKVGISTLKPCLDDLLECSLPQPVIHEIISAITEVPGVGYPHHLQTRRIGINYAIEFNMHVHENDSLKEACDKIAEVQKNLKLHFGPNTHIGVHLKLISD